MKIDIFCHIVPKKYLEAVLKMATSEVPQQILIENTPTLSDLTGQPLTGSGITTSLW